MQPHADWSKWAEFLQKYKLDGLASWLLEAGAPVNLMGAQVLYFGQPFVGGKQISSLAQMLEDENESLAFARFLRGEEE